MSGMVKRMALTQSSLEPTIKDAMYLTVDRKNNIWTGMMKSFYVKIGGGENTGEVVVKVKVAVQGGDTEKLDT